MAPFASELAAAQAAQAAWAQRPVRDRLRHVRALRTLLIERTDDVCAAVQADIARPPSEVLGTEVLSTAAALKYLEKRSVRLLAPKRVSWWDQPTWLMGCRDTIHHRPWGTVGIIGTWNYPVYLNVGQIAHALVAGNAVLWKPSENVPRTSELTTALFRDAGFPADLLQTLPATREAGPQLAEANVDHVVFTGSDTVGRKLAARLGERLVPSTMELSGCDAMFVLADANLELAAKAAWFGLTINRGQTCIAVRRIFVQREKFDAFVVALKPLVRAEPMGLVTPGQHAQADRLIKDATARGAAVLASSPSSPIGEGPIPPAPLSEAKGELVLPSPRLRGEGGESSSRVSNCGGGPGSELSKSLEKPRPPQQITGAYGHTRGELRARQELRGSPEASAPLTRRRSAATLSREGEGKNHLPTLQGGVWGRVLRLSPPSLQGGGPGG